MCLAGNVVEKLMFPNYGWQNNLLTSYTTIHKNFSCIPKTCLFLSSSTMYPSIHMETCEPSRPPIAIGLPLNQFNTVGSQPPVAWSTGLCQCCSDPSICCLTFWCPCITFGRIAEIVDQGSSSCGVNGALYTLVSFVFGCCCVYSYFYRLKLRQQYSLKGSSCRDFWIHFCCEDCALCQEYRELQSRGFDMKLGWSGNMERNSSAELSSAPVVPGGMTR